MDGTDMPLEIAGFGGIEVAIGTEMCLRHDFLIDGLFNDCAVKL